MKPYGLTRFQRRDLDDRRIRGKSYRRFVRAARRRASQNLLRTIAAALIVALPLAAHAAESCKSFYPLGEVTPPHCVKTFDRWGDGKAVAPDPRPATTDPYVDTYFKSTVQPQAPVRMPR